VWIIDHENVLPLVALKAKCTVAVSAVDEASACCQRGGYVEPVVVSNASTASRASSVVTRRRGHATSTTIAQPPLQTRRQPGPDHVHQRHSCLRCLLTTCSADLPISTSHCDATLFKMPNRRTASDDDNEMMMMMMTTTTTLVMVVVVVVAVAVRTTTTTVMMMTTTTTTTMMMLIMAKTMTATTTTTTTTTVVMVVMVVVDVAVIMIIMMMMMTLIVQTMSMMSVIAAIFVSISLSAAIVIAVICCRHGGQTGRRQRRSWVPRGGRGYAATADVVACEMEEFDANSFDQCSLSTTVDDARQPQPHSESATTRSTVPAQHPPSCRSCDSLSNRSACRLLKSDEEDGGSTDVDDGDHLPQSAEDSLLGDDLQPHQDDEESSSTSTNETAFSDDAQPVPETSPQNVSGTDCGKRLLFSVHTQSDAQSKLYQRLCHRLNLFNSLTHFAHLCPRT